MNQSDINLHDLMEKKLELHNPSLDFEDVWHMYKKSDSGSESKVKSKKRLIMPLVAVLTILFFFTVGVASYYRKIDKTDYQFKYDQEVIGKWRQVDVVENISDFNPQEVKNDDEFEIAFVDRGKILTSSQGGPLCEGSLSWTKGMILNKLDKTAGAYEIREIGGKKYLFFEYKDIQYIIYDEKLSYVVMEKVDSLDYSDYKVEARKDKVDYPFINNPSMIGEWQSVDFVEKIEDFNPQKRRFQLDLFLLEIRINEGGEDTYINSNGTFVQRWTQDLIIDDTGKTASQCEIKEIHGETYMFYEWKNGDYVYRGMEPKYYVLKKVK